MDVGGEVSRWTVWVSQWKDKDRWIYGCEQLVGRWMVHGWIRMGECKTTVGWVSMGE